MNYYKIIFIALSVSALCFISCGKPEETTTEEASHHEAETGETNTHVEITELQYKTAGIELGSIEKKGLSETIKATGRIDIPPQNYAEVSTYVGAVVKSILAIEGDFVKKGQTVMVLEHPDIVKLQESYITASSILTFSEKEYLRQKELYDQKVSSGKVFQEAEAKYLSEKGRVSSLRNQLEMLSLSAEELEKGIISRSIPLKAPVEGYIGHIRVSIGAYAEPNKVVFDVINLDDVHLHLSVFEKDIAKVKIGQNVYASVPNQPNAQIEATVFRIGKMLDEDTKAMDIHADIKNKHEGLLPGLFVNAIISVNDRSVTAVPDGAIVRSGGKQYIFAADESTCENPNTKAGQITPVNGAKILPGSKAEEACKDACCNPKNKKAGVTDNCCAGNASEGAMPNTFRMVEVKVGVSALGYTEIIPVENIEEHAQIVVKGTYYLISQLKSGETVGCCAPGEE